MFDGKAFGAEIVGAVKTYMTNRLAPVMVRLDALEKKVEALPLPSVDESDLDAVKSDLESIRASVSTDLESIRAALDNLPAVPELPDVPEMVEAAVAEALAQDAAGVRAWMYGIDEKFAAIPAPQDGKDIDIDEVRSIVAAEVARAVAAIPAPQDGASITADDVRPVVAECVAAAAFSLPRAKDGENGVGLAGALIDRHGNLIVTLSDGTTRELGAVVGKDADMAAVERSIAEKVAAIPVPTDGKDGVGFDDLDLVETDDGVFLRFVRGDIVKEFRLPIVTDRGIFQLGRSYNKGDGVTYAGSFWIAQEKTQEKPDSGKGWRLAVKRGRDGKDGSIKAAAPAFPVRVGTPAKAEAD